MKDELKLQMNDDELKNVEELKRLLEKDEPELQMNDGDSTYSPKRRRIGSSSNKLLPVLMGILIVVVFAGGFFYFVIKRSTEGDATLQSKMAAFEQKIASLERQIADLQGKLDTVGLDPALLQRLEALAQKAEALGKQKQPTAESKVKPSTPSKPPVLTEKHYHIVQKGETLYWISKKYGISVEELRKLNNLSADQSLRTGQKLLISPGR